jgi:hypothetical protein
MYFNDIWRSASVGMDFIWSGCECILVEGLNIALVRVLFCFWPPFEPDESSTHTLPSCFQSNHKQRNLEPELDDVSVFADSIQYRNGDNERQ